MNTRKGFTLVELLVVIAILAILATVSVVGYTSFIAGAEQTAADSEAASIAEAIDVALVMNKVVYIEKTPYTPAVPDDDTTTEDESQDAVDGDYIIFTRQTDGTYTVKTGVKPEGVKIAEIPDTLVDGLEYDATNQKLMYTSDKGAQAEVK